MNEGYEGENAGVDEQLKDLLSKISASRNSSWDYRYLQKNCNREKETQKTTKTSRSVWLGTLNLYMH